jgi:hypothetical protein
MRIAFIGASGAGKTYISERLAIALDLPLQPSFARRVAREMGFGDNPYDVDVAGQRDAFQLRVLACMIAWQHDQRAGFVADRSVFDVLTYTSLHASSRAIQESEESIMLAHRQGMLSYDRLYLCPIASFFKLGDDPARVQSLTYHKIYEQLLITIVSEYPWAKLDTSLERESDIGRVPWLRKVVQGIKGAR